MKKLITIAFVLISLVSCKKENQKLNNKTSVIDGRWEKYQLNYVYQEQVFYKFENGNVLLDWHHSGYDSIGIFNISNNKFNYYNELTTIRYDNTDFSFSANGDTLYILFGKLIKRF